MSPLFAKHSSISLRMILFGLLFTLLTLLLLGYIGYQARFFLLGPQITIVEAPASPSTDRVVEIEGTAKNIVGITLNGREIFTDPGGNFRERVVLQQGLNTITIEAIDRFDRSTRVHKEYVYLDEEAKSNEQSFSTIRDISSTAVIASEDD
mgnify:CR=1 FL=1